MTTNWTPRAAFVVALCFAINMIDGMDMVSLSYIATAIQTDWGTGSDALGAVFGAGLAGMAFGGLLHRPARRPPGAARCDSRVATAHVRTVTQAGNVLQRKDLANGLSRT